MNNFLFPLFTPVFSLYKKWDAWHSERKTLKRWTKAYDHELTQLDNQAHPWYPTLVDNLRTYGRQTPLFNSNADPLFLFKVGCAVARKLVVLEDIVGIQALSGPVGNTYRIELTEKPENDKVMSLSVVTRSINAGTHRLCGRWSVEPQRDGNILHDHSSTVETLISTFAAEIADELIAEVLGNLIAIARQNPNHEEVTPVTVDMTIPIAINQMCSQVAIETRRGVGNFLICSPMVVATLQAITNSTNSTYAPSDNTGSVYGSLVYMGILNGTIKVFSSNQVDDNIIVGYNGPGCVDTGYIYSPYIPVMQSGIVVDPDTFTPVVSLLTRYGKWAASDADTSMSQSYKYYRTTQLKLDFQTDSNN